MSKTNTDFVSNGLIPVFCSLSEKMDSFTFRASKIKEKSDNHKSLLYLCRK
jgi:hypothetical protein